MFIWRNLSPLQILNCVDHFYPNAVQNSLEEGFTEDAGAGGAPRQDVLGPQNDNRAKPSDV